MSDPRESLVVRSRKRGSSLSYEDMARSHVQELLRTAFGFEQVLVDEDGDVPMPCGTKDLKQLCREVGDLADHLGQMLAAVHGGSVTFPEAADVSSEGES